MVYTTMVSGGNESNHCSSNIDQSQERPVTFTRDTRCSSSTAETFESFGSFSVRTALRNKEIQEDIWALIRCSWRDSTRSQYDSALRKWLSYCSERSIDTSNPDVADILSFLTHLYNTGPRYSSISTVKSGLSNDVFIPGINKIADHPLVKRLMGGIFNKRPTKPRYNFTWDTSIVIIFLRTLTNSMYHPRCYHIKLPPY